MDRLPNVECIVRARIPTTTGAEMFLHLYQNDVDNKEHLAIVFGNHIRSRSLDRVHEGETEMDRMIRGAYVGRLHPGRVSSRFDAEGGMSGEAADKLRKDLQAPLVRIHSECYTGETAWSARCDCGEQLDEAARLMSMASESPSDLTMDKDGPVIENTALPSSVPATASGNDGPGGVIIYLRQEGRGIGLGEKLKAYNLQDLGSDTVEANLLLRHPADARSYGLATAMLVDLGLGADAYPEGIRLLTNNPDKVLAVEGPNREVRVKERVAMIPIAWRTGGQKGIRSREIEGYLQTKVSLCYCSRCRIFIDMQTDWQNGPYDSIAHRCLYNLDDAIWRLVQCKYNTLCFLVVQNSVLRYIHIYTLCFIFQILDRDSGLRVEYRIHRELDARSPPTNQGPRLTKVEREPALWPPFIDRHCFSYTVDFLQ